MKKPILVALDDSASADGVLAAACALARTYGSSLVLCRVIAMPALTVAPDGLPASIELQADLEKNARTALEAFLPRIPSGLSTKLVTILDVPWQGICEAATKEDVALIVIGSHGYGALKRILGTTASKVVNHADRSVLVVRGEWLG